MFVHRVLVKGRKGNETILVAIISRPLTSRSMVFWTSSALFNRLPLFASFSCSSSKASIVKINPRSVSWKMFGEEQVGTSSTRQGRLCTALSLGLELKIRINCSVMLSEYTASVDAVERSLSGRERS